MIDTGDPVVDARVSVDGTGRSTRSTVRGSFFLDAVDVGQGWRTIRAEKQIGGELWTGERAVLFDAAIPVQSNLLIPIGPASRQGTIRGRVTTLGGAGLGNVTVFLNAETTVAAGFRITDSGGRFEFRDVPAGTYQVIASARDLVNAGVNELVVTAGTVVPVNLSMLVSSGAAIGAPTGLKAQAFTYPESAAGVQARVRAVQRWLQARQSRAPVRAARRVRIQDWPAGAIIEVDLAWTPPAATDLAGYVLDRAIGGGGFGTIDRFADPTATAYYDLDPIYTPEQSYQFQISAASSSGVQGPPSNSAAARPLEPLGGLAPAEGVQVAGTPTFSWQPVSRAQRYQVLVLNRLPDDAAIDRMPLVWPPVSNLAAGQTGSSQLSYAGPPLQAGVTYYWLVFAYDQADSAAAQAVSASRIRDFTAR